jgi:RNA polymerase sigma-70 factor, ECF subfamily
MRTRSLAALFVDAAPTRGDATAGERLEQLLAAGLAAARAAWPQVDVPDEVFVPYLASRLAGDEVGGAELESRLASARIADLYLACACARGDTRALAAFEHGTLDVVDAALARMNMSAAIVDEVKQIVRRLLLVADSRPPRIVDYSGRGDLRGWVRVTAAREALRLVRQGKREVALEPELLEQAIAPDADAELEYVKTVYRGEFRAAFRDAMARLSDRERNLLAHQFVDGLTLDQLAALYRVHRATIARWLARARARLLRGTQAALRTRLRVHASELDSIMRLIESRLDVTLPGILRRDPEAGADAE